ncbi:hypothetical protein MKZ38_005721 [Zalerion maritima]|uniref:Uncharacterized protein n=1 Tax=Zalerion maritima TaxID=339359 RepID=A0AAD5RK32_9PEZI|nr:hypothetical protein MKZ38_005721 [Zalerion maritima]
MTAQRDIFEVPQLQGSPASRFRILFHHTILPLPSIPSKAIVRKAVTRIMADQIRKPVILILGIGDESQQHLTRADAESLMDLHPNPRGIFIPDTGITTEKNKAVTQQVIQFVRAGGTAVFGAVFSSSIRPPDFDRYFEKSWSLPWKFAGYYRTTVFRNESSFGRPNSGLPASYSQKAVNLKHVPRTSAWYLPDEDSVLESVVFGGAQIEDKTQAPVVFLKVGEGWLGYTGDVNAEDGTTAVVLGMFRLLS